MLSLALGQRTCCPTNFVLCYPLIDNSCTVKIKRNKSWKRIFLCLITQCEERQIYHTYFNLFETSNIQQKRLEENLVVTNHAIFCVQLMIFLLICKWCTHANPTLYTLFLPSFYELAKLFFIHLQANNVPVLFFFYCDGSFVAYACRYHLPHIHI